MNNRILHRQISGALKSAVAAHQQIHRKNISSATKRIIGNLKKFKTISYPDEPLKEALLFLITDEHRNLELLRKRLNDPETKKGARPNIAGKCSSLRYMLMKLDNILKYNFSQDAKLISDKQLERK